MIYIEHISTVGCTGSAGHFLIKGSATLAVLQSDACASGSLNSDRSLALFVLATKRHLPAE